MTSQTSDPPPDQPQETDPPEVGHLLLVILGLIREHLNREPIDRLRWLAIAAVLERVVDDDS